jgi:hypothetical protein
MKKLETTKLNAVIAWTRLRAMAPREFTSVADMELSREVMAIIKEETIDLIQKIEALGTMQNATIEDRQKNNPVSIEFEDAEFNYFFNLFGQKGKDWFGGVDDFLQFNKQMNETNQQAKATKK